MTFKINKNFLAHLIFKIIYRRYSNLRKVKTSKTKLMKNYYDCERLYDIWSYGLYYDLVIYGHMLSDIYGIHLTTLIQS